MAKPTAPLLSFGASGTIAKTAVFSKWKGRPYVRQHVIPGNPQSTEQTVTRDTFANAGSIWKAAPSLFTAPWDLFAKGQVLTGRNAFMGRFVADLRGLANMDLMPFSPGAKGGLSPLTITATPGVGQITVGTTNPVAPTGWTITAMVAAAIANDDPQTTTLYTITAGSDAVTFNSVVLAGLTAAQLYTVGAWLAWTKPDGSVAYGASINDTATPT